MLLRLSGVFIFVFWLASMSWLIWRDVWPGLTAGEPPVAFRSDLAGSGQVSYQAGIYNKYGHRIGAAWTTYFPIGATATREDVIKLGSFAGLAPTLLEITSKFTAEGELDEFTVKVLGQPMKIEVTGERFGSWYGFNIDVGTLHERIRVESEAAGLLGDVFRPFASLPGLEVGQSWRMQVVNPLSLMTGLGDRFIPMLVRVTGRETVTTADGRTVDCLVVEAPNAKAWVDDEGKVIVQQVELPVGGMLTIRDEPYDESAKTAARVLFEQRQPVEVSQ